jgi:SAM-dependent methyltransferase
MSYSYDQEYFAREYFELHPGKRRYFRYLLDLLRRHGAAAGPVLDAGSGRGLFVQSLRAGGIAAFGLEHALAAARSDAGRTALGDAQQPWPFRAGAFSAVTLLDVIEHLREPVSALSACRAALAPEGRCVVLTLNAWSLARPLLGRRWSYHIDPTHVRLFSPASLRRTLESAGLAVVETRTFFNFCVVGEGNPFLRPLRRIGRVVHLPWVGDSFLIVAKRS